MVQEEHTDQTNGTGTIKSIVFQQLWGERSIDDAIMRIRCENSGAGQPGYAAYDQLSDAQFSTVAVLDEAMSLVERVRCFAYGAAQRTPRGDMNGDGLCDFNDEDEYFANGGAQIDTPNYKAEMDFDRNGLIDDDDAIILDEAILNPQFVSAVQISNVGVNAPGPRNPVGYCGYLFNGETRLYTVRFRTYSPGLGRWLERDPLGYVDGMGLYEYVRSGATRHRDPMGLDAGWARRCRANDPWGQAKCQDRCVSGCPMVVVRTGVIHPDQYVQERAPDPACVSRCKVLCSAWQTQEDLCNTRVKWSLTKARAAGQRETSAIINASINVSRKDCTEVALVQYVAYEGGGMLGTDDMLDPTIDDGRATPFSDRSPACPYYDNPRAVSSLPPTNISITDTPSSPYPRMYKFIVIAICTKGSDAGRVYGTFRWAVRVPSWAETPNPSNDPFPISRPGSPHFPR